MIEIKKEDKSLKHPNSPPNKLSQASWLPAWGRHGAINMRLGHSFVPRSKLSILGDFFLIPPLMTRILIMGIYKPLPKIG